MCISALSLHCNIENCGKIALDATQIRS